MRKLLLAAATAAALAPLGALATTGYFAHGYGIKAKATGGVGIALPQDALAAATNPAGMVLVGNRADLGAEWFMPDRGASITGNAAGLNGAYDGNGEPSFLIPELGYNRMLSPTLSLGVSVYGNGGMNTTYERNPFAAFGATGEAGVDLMQLFIAPTLAWKFGSHAVGVSLNLAYQRFEMNGLPPAFAGFSSDPANFTNRGYDDSTGYGVRVGWIGQVSPTVTLGATYQSKTSMSKFDKYKGLFADQGDFDIPENYGVGIAWKASPALTVAGDIVQINYSGVPSVGNPVNSLFMGVPFGASNGPGFGWEDTTVFKVGVLYDLNPNLTLRAGYVTLRQPIPASQTFLNILAPGVVEDHLTLGATWKMGANGELTVMYMHAFEKEVNGQGSIPPGAPPAGMGGGEANLRMSQNSFGVAYGWKY
jgi:long-chain fatty acid transport protein